VQDGLFQLLFIIVILAASVMDAVSRNRKKREQMEEMERQEEAADWEPSDEGEVVATRDRAPPERPRPEAPASPRPDVPDRAPAPVARKERETSDSMVPDDLWAILTGEQRTPRPQQPRPAESSGREDPAAIASRRTEGALGSEVEREPPPTARPPILSPMPPRGGRTETQVPGWRDRLQQRRSPTRQSQLPDPVSVPGESEVYQEIEEPWSSLPDITEGEIGEDDRVLLAGEGGRRPGQRPRGSRSAYTRLLESGRPGDLRQAIVLSEILGPPKALRSGDGAPTSLRDPSS